jgi:ABC-2 type transport system ATP-binding protein
MSAIEVTDLRKSYGSTQAVQGISFEVREGEIFSLLGPNGAGKTTTIEILEGLRERDAGDVKVLEMDPWKRGYSLHKQIGVIPQGFTFFEKATPKESIEYYASLFGVDVNPNEILKEVILQDAANVRFENLSGGQKQKMGLALSLVNDPKLLFLDEPTTGLDPQARRAVWDVIRHLNKSHKSILLTTHYLEEAEQLADNVAIMHKGKLIAEGSPGEIVAKYSSGEKLRVQGPKALADYVRSATNLEVDYQGGYIMVHLTSKSDAVRTLDVIERSGMDWGKLTTVQESLEDIFVKLVGAKIEEEGEIAQ